jgi:cytochrome c5
MKRWLWVMALVSVFAFGCERQEATAPAAPAEPTREAAPGAPPPVETQYQIDMAAGEQVYQRICMTCHDQGIAGAPRQGDREDWGPRIEKGMNVLITHSIEGFQGNQGVMPPRGGDPSLSDDEVASAVAYMVELNR